MVGLRFPEEIIERIDGWADQNEITRSEAIRRLVEQALASEPKRKRK